MADTETGVAQEEQPTFVLGRESLQEFNEQIGQLVDEAKLRFEDAEIRVRAVDPANVGIVDVRLGESAFDQYDGSGQVIGYPLHRVRDVLDVEVDASVMVEARPDGKKMDVRIGDSEMTISCISPLSLREESDLPDMDLTTEAWLHKHVLDEIVAYADVISSHVWFGFDYDEYEFYATAQGDTDDYEYRTHAADLVDAHSTGDAHSLFSLDYLKNALEAVPDGTVVRMKIGEEFPLKLTYDIGPGEHGHVEYMQAPRI